MERLNRRDLFKAALGAVGVAVVGKAAPEAEPLTFTPGAYVVPPPAWQLDWVKPQPMRADEAWRDSFHATTETTFFPLYSTPRCDDPPVFWPKDTFATWTKHTAGPDGKIITNDGQPDIILNGQPFWVMHDIDGWEEGDGFDA